MPSARCVYQGAEYSLRRRFVQRPLRMPLHSQYEVFRRGALQRLNYRIRRLGCYLQAISHGSGRLVVAGIDYKR